MCVFDERHMVFVCYVTSDAAIQTAAALGSDHHATVTDVASSPASAVRCGKSQHGIAVAADFDVRQHPASVL